VRDKPGREDERREQQRDSGGRSRGTEDRPRRKPVEDPPHRPGPAESEQPEGRKLDSEGDQEEVSLTVPVLDRGDRPVRIEPPIRFDRERLRARVGGREQLDGQFGRSGGRDGDQM
jgi:hypothetical protein